MERIKADEGLFAAGEALAREGTVGEREVLPGFAADRAGIDAEGRAPAALARVPDQAAPAAVAGTANWSLAGVSAVRAALTALNVEANRPLWV